MTTYKCYISPIDSRAFSDSELDAVIPPDAIVVAEWDGESQYVAMLIGSMPAEGLPFAGWPNK